MTNDQLNEALYTKYISPTKKQRDDSIGIEIEMPVSDLSGGAVCEENIIDAAAAFREHFSFEVTGRDNDGNVNSMICTLSTTDLKNTTHISSKSSHRSAIRLPVWA